MKHFKKTVLACVVTLGVALPLSAQELRKEVLPMEDLLAELADPQNEDWQRLERKIEEAWAKSGSRTVDLLLKRGREALDAEDYKAALEHFTAVTDHAPEFAEGWNMRATAFFLLERYGLSVEDVQRALALNPNHFGALTGLGVMLERMGEEEPALEAFKAAQALHPHLERVNDAVKRLEKELNGKDI